jgi:hypothetical protein
MKLLVIGSLLAVLFPLSSFFWEQPDQQTEQHVVEGKSAHDRKLTVVEDKPVEVQEVVEVKTATEYSAPVESNIAPPLSTIPEPEAAQQRVNRLAALVGATVPVYAADCYLPGVDPTMVRGCYWPDQKVIFITKYALMYDDSFVTCILAHEVRHAWQDANGMFQYQNGILINRDWLEADATAYSGCS